jgi:hypothetical protein
MRDERKEKRKRVESNAAAAAAGAAAEFSPQRDRVSYGLLASCQAKLAAPFSSRTGDILLQENSCKQQLYKDG